MLESLPVELREAFESQDIARLQDVLSKMEPSEARACMKRCVDSGLWVAKDESVFDDNDDGEEDDAVDDADVLEGGQEPNSGGKNSCLK